MLRRSLFVLVFAAANLSLHFVSALAQRPGGGGGGVSEARPVSPDLPKPTVQRVDDKRFLKDAAMGGLTEVALGKLAVEKGSGDAVKQFGQKMIDDHTKASEELKQLAMAGGVNVPDALDSKHQSRVDKLARLSGGEFDKAYVKDQLKFHQQNVKEFQEEAQYGSVAEVMAFASKALPTLQQHLDLAKDLNKSKK